MTTPESVKTGSSSGPRLPNGRFAPGHPGNPKGRPVAPELEQLRAAIKQVEGEKKKDLFVHFINRAFQSDKVLVALMKKLIPDKTHVEGDALKQMMQLYVIFKGSDGNNSPELLERIKKGNHAGTIPT